MDRTPTQTLLLEEGRPDSLEWCDSSLIYNVHYCTFSNNNGDAEDDAVQKEYLYFTLKCRNYVDLFSMPNGLKTSLD